MTLQEIQALIDDHAQEGPTLEFKAGAALGKQDAKRTELVKDISGIAHAAGGRVIYGIAQAEQAGIAVASGPDPVTDPVMTGDWIAQIVKSNTMPPLTRFKCEEFAAPGGGRFIVVEVEQSTTAHQSLRDHKYWLRGAASTEPMLDFQIRDVMNRRSAPVIKVTLGKTIQQQSKDEHRYQIVPCIENLGTRTLERWEFRLGVPHLAFDHATTQGNNLGYTHLREGLIGTEYLWLITQYRPERIGRVFDVHPGQTIDTRALRCDPIPLLITPKNWERVSHPILWRIYSPNARPIDGEISFKEWCDY
jgi:hypothetical protein